MIDSEIFILETDGWQAEGKSYVTSASGPVVVRINISFLLINIEKRRIVAKKPVLFINFYFEDKAASSSLYVGFRNFSFNQSTWP